MLHRPLLAGALLLSQVCAQAQTILPSGSFTPANFDTTYTRRVANASDLVFVSDPLQPTRKVVKLTLNDSAAAAYHADYSPKAELGDDGQKRWYGFSFMLPADWEFHPNPVTVAQLDYADSGFAAPLALVVRGNELELELNANHLKADDTEPATPANTQKRVFTIDQPTRGKWICVVISANWNSALRKGDMALWYNDQRTVLYEAARAHNTYAGARHTPRLGLSATGPLGVAQRTLLAEAVWVGGPNSYAALFQNSMPCASYEP